MIPPSLRTQQSEENIKALQSQFEKILHNCSKFNWPTEATSDVETLSNDSNPEVDNQKRFYEGPFLNLIFTKIKNLPLLVSAALISAPLFLLGKNHVKDIFRNMSKRLRLFPSFPNWQFYQTLFCTSISSIRLCHYERECHHCIQPCNSSRVMSFLWSKSWWIIRTNCRLLERSCKLKPKIFHAGKLVFPWLKIVKSVISISFL